MRPGERWIACGDPHVKHFKLALLLTGALGLGGCYYDTHHFIGETVHDEDLTFDDFDGTVSYDAENDNDLADPPVPVHEFNADDAEAAGAHQVINGKDWLKASDHQRNDMLRKVEAGMPEGSTVVLVVATGEVWVILPEDFAAVAKVVEPWWYEEYDDLDEYVGEGYAGPQLKVTPFSVASENAQLVTRRDYDDLTAYVKSPMATPSPEVVFLHDFNPQGLKYTLGTDSLRVMTYSAWALESPRLRGLELKSIAHYLDQTPAYQGPGRQVAFGVTAPWGNVFAVPQMQLNHLVSTGEVKTWTVSEYYSLPVVPPTPNHATRWERLDLSTRFNF